MYKTVKKKGEKCSFSPFFIEVIPPYNPMIIFNRNTQSIVIQHTNCLILSFCTNDISFVNPI